MRLPTFYEQNLIPNWGIVLHDSVLPFRQTRALGTMTSADFSRQAILRHGTSNTSSSPCVRETSSDKGIVFPSYTYFIYTNRSE